MKNRTKRLSIRTTESVEKKLSKIMRSKIFRYYSKSDIINMILEENLGKYDSLKKQRTIHSADNKQ
ncbi:MAG: hypothetical protein ACLFP1_07640 [Candidatus Goldiibacteriota bacterium]